MRTRKRQAFKGDRIITSITLDKDLYDATESMSRSDLINKLLRAHLKKDNPRIEWVETMSSNQRIKNLNAIQEWLSLNKYAQRSHLKAMLMPDLGVVEKKMDEYLQILSNAGKIIVSGPYVVDPGWEKPADMPMPGTEAFVRWSIAREAMRKTASKQEALNSHEEELLASSSAPAECQHTDRPFNCKVCGKPTCTGCSSSYEIGADGRTTGKCGGC